jgi:hypothetical protein
MEKIDIFPVQIIKGKVAEHQAVKDFLMTHALPEFEKHGVNDKTNNTYTDYLPGAYNIYWPFLYNLYKPTIVSMLKELEIVDSNKFHLKMTGWYNFTNYTNTKFVHDHTGGPTTINFSCVHYVHMEQDTMSTVFQNPNMKLIKASSPTKDLRTLPKYFYDYYYNPPVEEGDIVMFPSWLDHFIPPHVNNTLRVTTALNIMLKLDSDEGM